MSADTIVQELDRYYGEHESPLGRLMWAGSTRLDGVHQHRSMQILGAYALVYITRGQGSFQNQAGFSCDFAPGSLFVLFPAIGHRYGSTSDEGLEEFYLTFKGPLFELWQRQGLLNPAQPHLHPEPVAPWLQKLRAVTESVPADALAALQPINRLCGFLTEAIVAQHALRASRDEPQWLGHARMVLGSNLHLPLGARSVAAEIGVSYDVFRHAFRGLTGTSPARYRMNQRIAAACDLLLHSSLRVNQIAEQLGFSSEFHFSQRFKEHQGVSPSAFRLARHQNES